MTVYLLMADRDEQTAVIAVYGIRELAELGAAELAPKFPETDYYVVAREVIS
jgi:hypothetical protein